MASSSASAFSPLTLFESTLTNATMLTETMSQTELLTAHQISARLQNGIVEALHKLSENLTREVESQRAAAEVARAHLADAQAKVQAAEARHKKNSGGDELTLSGVKLESTVLRKYVSEPTTSTLDFSVKTEMGSDDDDCVLLDCPNSANGSASGNGLPPRKRRALGGGGRVGDTFGQGQSAVSTHIEPKVALRTAYQQIFGSGPYPFDVTKPISEGSNRSVAVALIDKARQLCPSLVLSDEQWQSYVHQIPCVQNSQEQDPITRRREYVRRYHRKTSKLQRRQKSYTELRSKLSQEEAGKYQYILSRDVTSSDEELEGFEGTTRVRLLSWESAEAAEMKRRLDTIYFECFATDKQLLAHHRCLRDGNAMSTRGPPENAPAWMRKKVPSSGDAAPSDSTQLPMMLSSSSCGEREPPSMEEKLGSEETE